MENWDNLAFTVAELATGPTPCPEHSVDTHTVRLYCKEVGGETCKKRTRT